jgi:hypothetical protein
MNRKTCQQIVDISSKPRNPFKIWSRQEDLNPQHADYDSARPFVAVHGYVAISKKFPGSVSSMEHIISWHVILYLPLYFNLSKQTAPLKTITGFILTL